MKCNSEAPWTWNWRKRKPGLHHNRQYFPVIDMKRGPEIKCSPSNWTACRSFTGYRKQTFHKCNQGSPVLFLRTQWQRVLPSHWMQTYHRWSCPVHMVVRHAVRWSHDHFRSSSWAGRRCHPLIAARKKRNSLVPFVCKSVLHNTTDLALWTHFKFLRTRKQNNQSVRNRFYAKMNEEIKIILHNLYAPL